jgi:hypothetical protein
MAKRERVTSSKHPPGESPPAERWWKTPTVIAAMIVAIIGLGALKPKPSAPRPTPPTAAS